MGGGGYILHSEGLGPPAFLETNMNTLKTILSVLYTLITTLLDVAIAASLIAILAGMYTGHITGGCNKVGCMFTLIP